MLEPILPQTTMFADAVGLSVIEKTQTARAAPLSLPPSDGGMSSAKSLGGHIIAFLLRLPQLPHLDMLCLRVSCCGILGIPQHSPGRIAPPCTSQPGPSAGTHTGWLAVLTQTGKAPSHLS